MNASEKKQSQSFQSYKRAATLFRFLVIEDDRFTRHLLVQALTHLGALDITVVTDGRQAIDEVFRRRFDIVLCDLNMPEMDGVEFLRHLSATEFSGGVILVSAEDSRILEASANLAKVHDLNLLGALNKPVKTEELEKVISQYSGPNPRSENGALPFDISRGELEEAILNEKLEIYLQPKISVRNNRVVGAESLVRWHHPVKGTIPPSVFVRLAEEFNLINKLTDFVCQRTAHEAQYLLASNPQLRFAINISIETICLPDFPNFILTTLEKYDIPPKNFILEVTESRLMTKLKQSIENLTRLNLKGITLSIDDFGTGHSSLMQLMQIPFGELKIDRAFVQNATHSHVAQAILKASVSLAHSIDTTSVAEGLETRKDWDLIASLGIDVAQGYFIAHPMPVHEFRRWLSTKTGTLSSNIF
ncbi:MAG: EAL domain-containing response regulator [Sneathiellales bacterium]|nr:EAL domain-containing response regulator [Sneathiellales bacterium]